MKDPATRPILRDMLSILGSQKLFRDFSTLFLAYPSKPITCHNPYPGPSTEGYGLREVRLYISRGRVCSLVDEDHVQASVPPQ
jgi:hypothetical protein